MFGASTGLGSAAFRQDYSLRYAYVAGSMFKGISSASMVVRLARSGFLGFFGSGGMTETSIREGIQTICSSLSREYRYGVNLLCNPYDPEAELAVARLLLELEVPVVEAAGFTRITPSLALLCAHRYVRQTKVRLRIIGKVSHPETARAFLAPPPDRALRHCVERGLLNPQDAQIAANLPVANDLCVEADSGGHTDMGNLLALLPRILSIRDEMARGLRTLQDVRVGAGGGIGSPRAVAAAFVLGADFILTGSINQCTVEAGTSHASKDILQQVDVRDTGYAPAGDQFERGTRVQVVRRGLLFAGRANHLRQLWQHHRSIEELGEDDRRKLEADYFGCSLEAVLKECSQHYARIAPARLEQALRDPKAKMAMIFRWYFVRATRLARQGDPLHRLDYQIHCGPALGAFNDWVRGSRLEDWRERHVDSIAVQLMESAARHLGRWTVEGGRPGSRIEEETA